MRVQKFSAVVVTVVAVASLGLFGSAAGAEEGDLLVEITAEQVNARGEVGSSVAMGQAAVDAELVGQTCSVVATATNQSSVHPGNVLVVSSGDSTVEIAGIEDEAGAETVQGGTLTLGETVSVSVVLGDDGATSLGSSLVVTCEALPETPPTPPTPKQPTYTG